MSDEIKAKKESKGCYKTRNTKTGKDYTRSRPAITATVSESTFQTLKELELECDMPFANIVEQCIMYGVPQFRREHLSNAPKVTPIVQERKKEDMTNEERFMRGVIFDFKDNERWKSY
jgi:hypothetical protein